MLSEERRKECIEKAPEHRFMFGLAKFFMLVPMRLLYPLKVYGNKNIGRRKVIIVMNHKSALDPIIMSAHLKPPFSFMAKETLGKNRFLSWIFERLNVIFVKRGEADISAVDKALGVLESGRPFAIFPEGTRNKENNGEIRRFKTGAAFFALTAESVIVPIAIEKSAKLFVRNRMIVGREFDVSEFYKDKPDREALRGATEKIFMRVSELNDIFKTCKDSKSVNKAISELDETREEREKAFAEKRAAEQMKNIEAFLRDKEGTERSE